MKDDNTFIAAIGVTDPDKWQELKQRIMQVLDFNTVNYRDNFLKRRIEVRLRSLNIKSYKEYMDYFTAHADERELLLKELTIHVTHFFRDFKLYQVMRNKVLPDLIEKKERQGDMSLNIWSAGCSSGEEPYSVAILLKELLGSRIKQFTIKIDALDISRKIIDAAKKGVFSEASFTEIPNDYKKKYFVQDGDRYILDRSVIEMVSFSVGDIIHYETSTRYDIVFCRNTVIYFERETKRALYESISEKMKKGGYLVLGKTEFLDGTARDKFDVFDNNERIYVLSA